MTAPYDTWNNVCKAAWNASSQSYSYDLNLIVRQALAKNPSASQTSRKVISGEALANYGKYRSNNETRKNFTLQSEHSISTDRKEFVYKSEMSLDTVSVHVLSERTQDVVVLGFRGTDPADPMRLLDYIPEDYDSKLKSNYEKALERPFTWDRWNSLKFQDYSRSTCTEVVEDKSDKRGSILSKTTELYANVGGVATNYLSDFSGSAVSSAITQKRRESDKQWDYLHGGADRAAPYSDFVSDLLIAKGKVVESSDKNIRSIDEKHMEAARHAEKVVKYFLGLGKKTIFIFSGHSLGGSLALISHIRCKTAFEESNIWYVGFNAGQLKNFDSFFQKVITSKELFDHYLKQTIHFTNQYDIVSQGYKKVGLFGYTPLAGLGSYIPVVEYFVSDAAKHYIASTHSGVHGIWTFAECGRAVNKAYRYKFEGSKVVEIAGIPPEFSFVR
jgi:hypothetical protein